jgi:hypothetical protein
MVEDIVFWPWVMARRRGRLIGLPLIVLGAPWVLLLTILIMGPALLIDLIRDSGSGSGSRPL